MITPSHLSKPTFEQPNEAETPAPRPLTWDMKLPSSNDDPPGDAADDGITVKDAVALLTGYTAIDVHNRIANGLFRKVAAHTRPLRISKADVLAEAARPTKRPRTCGKRKSRVTGQPNVAVINELEVQARNALPAVDTDSAKPTLIALADPPTSPDRVTSTLDSATKNPLFRDQPIANATADVPTVAATEILLVAICPDVELRLRADVIPQVAENYAAQMKEGRAFPPVDLFSGDGEYYIGDGWYRLEAARLAELESFPAHIRGHGKSAALRWALKSNTAHGQPLTNADKRKKVTLALKEYPDRSGNELAHLCGE